MRLWFVGSHGTGKTTQLEHFTSLHSQFHVIRSERRKLVEDGVICVNREAAPWDEIVIGGDVMKHILMTPQPSIADRSWVDKCAYAQLLPYPEEILNAMHNYYSFAFPGDTEEDVYVYFPPVLDLVADGMRDTDVEYQRNIDFMIQFYLDFFGISYFGLTGLSVQDRYLEIADFIKLRGFTI